MRIYFYRYDESNQIKKEEIYIPPFSTVEAVVQNANINAEEKLIILNDKRACLDQIVKEGDVIKIFPLILGG